MAAAGGLGPGRGVIVPGMVVALVAMAMVMIVAVVRMIVLRVIARLVFLSAAGAAMSGGRMLGLFDRR
ncbi:hypothetical protein EGU64_31275 [Achromobacter denitrificans]|nr:hypothetical protein EGU64_31275 [Achromobacter denitrificans]